MDASTGLPRPLEASIRRAALIETWLSVPTPLPFHTLTRARQERDLGAFAARAGYEVVGIYQAFECSPGRRVGR